MGLELWVWMRFEVWVKLDIIFYPQLAIFNRIGSHSQAWYNILPFEIIMISGGIWSPNLSEIWNLSQIMIIGLFSGIWNLSLNRIHSSQIMIIGMFSGTWTLSLNGIWRLSQTL